MSDAISVLQPLQAKLDKDLDLVHSALHNLCKNSDVKLQWFPSHLGISRNDTADYLAKPGTPEKQPGKSTKDIEEKVKLRTNHKTKRTTEHSNKLYPSDFQSKLSRKDHTVIFRLITNHNSLNNRMFKIFEIVDIEPCQ